MRRPVLIALAAVVALVLALLLGAALAIETFLGWPRQGAPDLYGRLDSSAPLALSATIRLAELRLARREGAR